MDKQLDFMNNLIIDMGSTNTLMAYNGVLVVEQPTIVAIDTTSDSVVAVGDEARQALEKSLSGLKLIRPIREGMVADLKATQEMLGKLVEPLGIDRETPLRVILCTPVEMTQKEYDTMQEAVQGLGADEVVFLVSSIAGSVGAGVDINDATGNVIIDIGGGLSEISIIASGKNIVSKTGKVAGEYFTSDIIFFLKNDRSLLIEDDTAEKLKSSMEEMSRAVGDFSVKGRDMITGKPIEVSIRYEELAKWVDTSISRIEDLVDLAVYVASLELSEDIYQKTIYLTGGGAMLHNLGERLQKKVNVPIQLVENPMKNIIIGANILLERGTPLEQYGVKIKEEVEVRDNKKDEAKFDFEVKSFSFDTENNEERTEKDEERADNNETEPKALEEEICDENGNVIEKKLYRGDTMLWRELYQYDDKNNLIKICRYNAKGLLNMKISYKYNEQNDKIEECFYFGEAQFPGYNSQMKNDDEDGGILSEKKFYDEKGNLVKEQHYGIGGKLVKEEKY